MPDPLLIPGAARVAAGAFVAGAGLVGGVWVWTSRTPMPAPPPPQTVVLWPAEPESGAPAQADPIVEAQTSSTGPTATDPVAAPSLAGEEPPAPGPTRIPVEPEPEPNRTPEEELPTMPIDAGPADQPAAEPPTTPEPTDRVPSGPAVQRIGINSAGVAELQLLPGIGPVLAQRIVDDRAANGRFGSLNDLQRVKGIGEKTAAKLAALIAFN